MVDVGVDVLVVVAGVVTGVIVAAEEDAGDGEVDVLGEERAAAGRNHSLAELLLLHNRIARLKAGEKHRKALCFMYSFIF